MHINKSFLILSTLLITLFSFNTHAGKLVRFYIDHDAYYLVHPSKITNIYIDVDDDETEIYIDKNQDKSALWKITLENNPESEAMKLVEAIYSETRKEILNVKVASFN